MTSIFLALIAQAINAVVVIVDKHLIGEKGFGRPAAYAWYVSLLSGVVIVLTPFKIIHRPSLVVVILSLLSGLFYVYSLLALYKSLKKSDATDVSPAYTAMTAIATFLVSAIVFAAPFSTPLFVGLLLLIAGTALMSFFRFSYRVGLLIIVGGLFAGISSVLIKLIFLEVGFANGFFWSRMANVVAAFSLLLVPSLRREIKLKSTPIVSRRGALLVANKALAGLAMLFILIAIKFGNVAVVNALAGWQFIFLLVFVAFMKRMHWHVDVEKLNSLKTIFRKLVATALIVAGFVFLFFDKMPTQQKPIYGVSFSQFHSNELKLDWQETYLAILNDLNVKNFRFSAHWPLTQPEENKFDFSALDFQMNEAYNHEAKAILSVGRRLPGWPECHEPDWLKGKTQSEKDKLLLQYIEKVVNRYRLHPALKYWQVENEPFLPKFAEENCGALNEDLFKKELELVRELDPNHKIVVTDGGEFGKWYQAYRAGDVFGTTMYLYIWSPEFGKVRYPIVPEYFTFKTSIIRMLSGEKKEMILVELGAEPWLLEPIIDASVDVQLSRLGIDKFNEVIKFAGRTNFSEQYLWGAEWWYWMKQNGHPEFWSRAKELFQ